VKAWWERIFLTLKMRTINFLNRGEGIVKQLNKKDALELLNRLEEAIAKGRKRHVLLRQRMRALKAKIDLERGKR
jgi:hypothetical protein